MTLEDVGLLRNALYLTSLSRLPRHVTVSLHHSSLSPPPPAFAALAKAPSPCPLPPVLQTPPLARQQPHRSHRDTPRSRAQGQRGKEAYLQSAVLFPSLTKKTQETKQIIHHPISPPTNAREKTKNSQYNPQCRDPPPHKPLMQPRPSRH